MKQVSDPAECRKITDLHPQYFTFDVEDWFTKDKNYCLREDDNIAFAEYKMEGVYFVHFCFNSAKGRQAIDLVDRIFNTFCLVKIVKIVIGLVHVENKKARLLIRRCKFKSLGLTNTETGECEMFYRTNK